MGVHLPGAEDDAGKVAVVDGVRVGLGLQAESAVALREEVKTINEFDGCKIL